MEPQSPSRRQPLTLQPKIQRTIAKLEQIVDNMQRGVAGYLPGKEGQLQEILTTFNRTISKSEILLSELRTMNLNRILLQMQYNYILAEIIPGLLDTETKAEYALSMVQADAKLGYLMGSLDETKLLIDDIAVMREHHPNYEEVKKHIRRVWPKDRNGLANAYKEIRQDQLATYASFIKSEKYQSEFKKSAVLSLSKPKYKLADTQASVVVYSFLRNPHVQVLKKMWSVSENVEVFRSQYDYIAINQKLYIPRAHVPTGVRVDLYQPELEKICVRLLCDRSVKFRYQEPANMCCVPRPKSDCYDQLILHFHGGSFVALTSRTSQTFTRRWATNFQVPILSVDYRLAPESTFPAALEDCYSVYLFVVNNLASHMNIRPRNIILAGDSAGGNLVMALTALILKNGVQAPNSLFLAYPQADLRQQFSPSRLNGLDDVQLFPTALQACHQAYCQDEFDNPWVSPLLLTQSVIGEAREDQHWPLQWPKTRIVVGNKDPYFDDSLRMLELMAISKIDCEMTIFQELGHGFLHLDTQISQCQGAVREAERILESLLYEEDDD